MPKKLLLADDSVTIQRVIELTFSGEDVQVLAVGDGEEAIARIPAEKPVPAVKRPRGSRFARWWRQGRWRIAARAAAG